MATIQSVRAYELLDSRGNPTVGVEMIADSGEKVLTLVPSGASTGVHEALELRDSDASRYGGKGVLKALEAVNGPLADYLVGKSLSEDGALAALDQDMINLDGTENKAKFGANAILGCSMAAARLKAAVEKVELYEVLAQDYQSINADAGLSFPVPCLNVINGGSHADNKLDFQEFMLVPAGFDTFADAFRAGVEIYHSLKKLLLNKGLVTAVGDEGGFAPDVDGARGALTYLMEAIEAAGYTAGEQIYIAIDVAASEFYNDGVYDLVAEGKKLDSEGLTAYYAELVEEFPIVSIEDGMDEDDFEGWKLLTEKLGDKIQLVGDDLFVTNEKRLTMGIEQGMGNSILIKLNQIGTVKETLEVVALGASKGFNSMISHRSGETEDTFISDLVVATGAGQIKSGAPCRTDRVAKYNRLLMLEIVLADKGVKFAGKGAFGL